MKQKGGTGRRTTPPFVNKLQRLQLGVGTAFTPFLAGLAGKENLMSTQDQKVIVFKRGGFIGLVIAVAIVVLLLVLVLAWFVQNRQQVDAAAAAAVNQLQDAGATLIAPATSVPAAPAATATPTATPTRAPTAKATSVPTAAPTKAMAVDTKEFVTNSVGAAMASAGFSGTDEQIAATKADLTKVGDIAATNLQNAGFDLSDEVVQKEFVGALVEEGIVNGLFCWASNLGPENEIQGAGVQRRELSTSGLLHVDHYNSPDLPSVSILVRAGEAAVVAGYGSMFEFPWDRCGQYDFVADASRYAESRRDWGHSGVVFATLWDALNGVDPVVNLWGLSPEEIDQLRPRLWAENSANTASVRAVTGAQVDAREEACGAAQVTPHRPVHGELWNITGPAVVSFWSNWPDMQTPEGIEYKLLVPEGTSVSLRGGGTAWTWPAGCGDVAQTRFAENGQAELNTSYIVQ